MVVEPTCGRSGDYDCMRNRLYLVGKGTYLIFSSEVVWLQSEQGMFVSMHCRAGFNCSQCRAQYNNKT